MKIEWVFIELIAIFIDGLTRVYFLNSRYVSKQESFRPQILTWLCLVGWGTIATMLGFHTLISEGVTYVILLAYLFLTKHGTILQRIFGFVLLEALTIGISLLGAGLATAITNSNVQETLQYQENSRLFAIILIKAMQIIIIFTLAKKRYRLFSLKKKPAIVLTCATIIILASLLVILFNLSGFSDQTNLVLVWLAAGLLIVLIVIFIMYEMFVREETRNIDLSTRIQRLEMETHFFSELDAIQTDLRTWRHEYKNNLVAIRALVESGSLQKTLDYIDGISSTSLLDSAMLYTGNTVLDAVINSKLILARSRGINVNIQAVYPESISINDNDLCAIAGNLLDNAIEACMRMSENGNSRFITISILLKGKNLALSIINSYNGEIKRAGSKLLTVKNTQFHGIGIQYVDSIVGKYQGHVLREYKDGVFETHVMLPLVSPPGATIQ